MRKLIKFLLALIISVYLSLWLFYQMISGNLLTKVAGFSVLRVDSGSMEKSISVGDILIIKECADYEIDDVVTYNVDNQYLVTHRIVEKEGNNFVTKGDNNNTVDNEKVTKDNIEGKVILNSKLLRFFYKNWLIAIIVVLLILILL